MQKIQGVASRGGDTIVTRGQDSTTISITSFPSCTVTVYNAGTVTPSTIFSDNVGTPKANPFTANADGDWFFYVANGRYDIQFSGTGISSPFTLGDVTAYDEATDLASTTNIGQTKLSVAPASASSPIAVGENDPRFTLSPYKIFNVKAYGAVGDGVVNDTTAIDAAIAAAQAVGGGTILFPEGVYRSNGGHVVTSGLIISGVSQFSTGGAAGGSQIQLANGGAGHLFKFGELLFDVVVRDVKLRGYSSGGGVGILAEGSSPNSSGGIKFENVRLTEFAKAVYFHTLSSPAYWQTDYWIFDNCRIECFKDTIGIHCDTPFVNILFNGCQFYLEGGSANTTTAFKADQIGSLTFVQCYGNGESGITPVCTAPGVLNDEFVRYFLQINGFHAAINFIGCHMEGIQTGLENNYAAPHWPIIIQNSAIGLRIVLNARCTVKSEGSYYWANTILLNANDISLWSDGDYISDTLDFCLTSDTSKSLYEVGAGVTTGNLFVAEDNVWRTKSYRDVSYLYTNLNTTATSIPSMSLLSENSAKKFLRMGLMNSSESPTEYYDFTRDNTSGYLRIDGSQATPFRGLASNGVLEFTGFPTAVVAPSGVARLSFNTTSGFTELSESGGGYKNLVKANSALVANNLLRVISDTLVDDAGIKDNGTTVTVDARNLAFDTTSVFSATLLRGGNPRIFFPATGKFDLRFIDSGSVGWSSGDPTSTTPDVGLERESAGTLKVSDGGSGDGALQATSFRALSGISNDFYGGSVASAATLVPVGNVMTVTGTTNITEIDTTGIIDGTRLTLLFSGILTVTDGVNLYLAGNLVTAADTTLDLVVIGGKCYELSRSAN